MLLIVCIFAALFALFIYSIFYFKEIQFDSCLDKVIIFNLHHYDYEVLLWGYKNIKFVWYWFL